MVSAVLAAALAVSLCGRPGLADVIGEARIIDGDTIEIGGERIRLHGIDAPEARQACTAGGTEWLCGEASSVALADRTEGRVVTCRGNRRDRYGRLIAVCFEGDDDLNAWMVREGWAVAYRRYAHDYVEAEAEARGAGRGMWAGEFTEPSVWRQGAPPQAQR